MGKTKTQENNDELSLMRKKIKHRKTRRRNMWIAVGIAAAAAAALTAIILATRTYSSYQMLSSVEREDESGSGYVSYKNGYIRYSKSGMEYINAGGNKEWNVSLNMEQPVYRCKGDKVVFADIKGNQAAVFDETGQLGVIQTGYSVLQADASKTGAFAVLLQDESDSFIKLYDTDGSVIYSVKTAIDGDGTPIDIAINDTGSRLAYSYVKAGSDGIESGIRFYDFDNTKEESKKPAGEIVTTGEGLTGDICFFGNDTVAAVSERHVRFYGFGNEPEQTGEFSVAEDVNTQIVKTFNSDDRLGIVMHTEGDQIPDRIMVFNSAGSKTGETDLPESYDKYHFAGDNVVMTSGNRFALMKNSGRFITEQTNDTPVLALMSNGGSDYYLIDDNYIRKVRLK